MKLKTRLLYTILLLTALVMFGTSIYAQSTDPTHALQPGGAIVVSCPNALLVTPASGGKSVRLACPQLVPTPTGTPQATPPPGATPTPMPHDPADLTWHSPGAHGDRPAHEHGSEPPSWVADAGYSPSFTHVAGTPNENHFYFKHTAFKGWAGNFHGVDWFGIWHLDFNPGGEQSRFHSYQLWLKDATGAVSHMHGWLDFGEGNNTLPNLRIICGKADPTRPIIQTNKMGCTPILFTTWYANAANPGIDVGFSISPNYYAGGDPTDPSTWVPVTGNVKNFNRRIEFAYYGQWGGVRKTGTFWTTQLGNVISGPDDPLCNTIAPIGDRNYMIVCIQQTIQPTLPEIRFPGNAVQTTFPGSGIVKLPN